MKIEAWVSELRSLFAQRAPDLLAYFETYASEAIYARSYLDSDLRSLPPGARILEVGAGSFILTSQLRSEGFEITGLEPIGDGFSHFVRMRQLVLDHAKKNEIAPAVLELAGESLNQIDHYDYAFSLNVMEHVQDVRMVIERVGRALKSGSTYRFSCPNYLFPYEPHFNMPTLVSRRLTEIVMRRRIFETPRTFDAVGLWESLNWINVWQVSAIVRRLPDLELVFNRHLLAQTFERIGKDAEFAARRSRLIRTAVGTTVALGIHKLFWLAPVTIQPIMDCRITRKRNL